MKKNLITLIILVLVFANLALTAVLTITIVPQTRKANELISKVSSAIDLDLEGGVAIDTTQELTMEQITPYSITDPMTINLRRDDSGQEHYAVISVSISMDNEHDDYATYGETIAERESIIKDIINSVIAGYTADELNEDQNGAKEEILTALQERFASTFIVGVNFSSVTIQ